MDDIFTFITLKEWLPFPSLKVLIKTISWNRNANHAQSSYSRGKYQLQVKTCSLNHIMKSIINSYSILNNISKIQHINHSFKLSNFHGYAIWGNHRTHKTHMTSNRIKSRGIHYLKKEYKEKDTDIRTSYFLRPSK